MDPDAWAEALASWAIPDEIMAPAPEDPWAYRVAQFAKRADEPPNRTSPSYARTADALPERGSILDVGCGAGAASLPHADRAARIVGVDESAEMIAAFAERAAAVGVTHDEVTGRWPDVMDQVAAADLVVCHHVLYNVSDIEPFVTALADHARRRVVIEMTAEHPRTWENPLWKEVHGIDRPTRPTAEDAVIVLKQVGVPVRAERWTLPLSVAAIPIAELVAEERVSLCVGADRDTDIARALEKHPPPPQRGIATLWWDA